MSGLGLTTVRKASPSYTSPGGIPAEAHGSDTYTDPYASHKPTRSLHSQNDIMSALSSGFTTQPLPMFPSAGEGVPAPEKAAVFADITSSSPNNHADNTQQQKPQEVTSKRQQQLENAIKAAVKKRRTVYKDEHALLAQAFGKVDDGSGSIDAEQLQQVLPHLSTLRFHWVLLCVLMFADVGVVPLFPKSDAFEYLLILSEANCRCSRRLGSRSRRQRCSHSSSGTSAQATQCLSSRSQRWSFPTVAVSWPQTFLPAREHLLLATRIPVRASARLSTHSAKRQFTHLLDGKTTARVTK